MNQPIRWLNAEISAMRPAERIHPAEWIPQRFKLPRDSAIKGYCDLDLLPQFKPVLDWIIDNKVDEIYLCSSSQSGKTTIILAGLCYLVKQKRWSAGVIFADENTAEEISTKRFAPAWEDDQELAKEIDLNQWTKTFRGFIGGHSVKFAWASSVAATASWSAGIVYADEIDKPGYSLVSKEGNKLYYIRQRLESYWGAKFLASSTPTDENGNITAIQRQPDVLVFDFHVPCPHCGQFQPLKFSPEYAYGFPEGEYRGEDGRMHKLGKVIWEGGKTASPDQIQRTARYECGECGKLWTTAEKNRAMLHGKAVPRTEPAGQRKLYLHNSRLTSLFKGGRFEKLAEEFVSILNTENKAEKGDKLQAWVQNALAEPYVDRSHDRKESTVLILRDDRPRGLVPSEGVLGLTCGADTQDNGFYYIVRAWGNPTGEQLESWLIREGFVETKEGLETLISGRYQDVSGNEYVISLTMLDAMGHRTAEVYDWCRNKIHIKPCKGEQRMATPYSVTQIDTYPGTQKPIPGGLKLYRVNTQYYKDKLFNKLSISPGDPGVFNLHSEVTDEYSRHMVSEFRNNQGFWECPQGKLNHYWDCEVLALAAADVLGIQHWKPPKNIQTDEGKRDSPSPRKTDWFGGREHSNWFRR